MRKRLLLILPSLQQRRDYKFRLVKYSRFPPLSLLTIAGLTPEDEWEILVRDEHIESSEVNVDVDLVGIQTYISSANRAYELAERWRSRGAKVVLGGLHPTSMPEEAAPHADAIVLGPAEMVWGEVLDDFGRRKLQKVYRGRSQGSAALVPLPRRDLMNQRGYLIRHNVAWSRVDPLWIAIIRLGLMPMATRIFNRVLRWDTRGKKVIGAGRHEEAWPSMEGELVRIDRLEGVTLRGAETTKEAMVLVGEKEG